MCEKCLQEKYLVVLYSGCMKIDMQVGVTWMFIVFFRCVNVKMEERDERVNGTYSSLPSSSTSACSLISEMLPS